ncbi:MAG: sortase [Actinomycetota bacterium]
MNNPLGRRQGPAGGGAVAAPGQDETGSAGKRRGRRAVGTALLLLSVAMLVAAGWLGAYPFYTNVRAEREQTRLTEQFDQLAESVTPEAYAAGAVAEGKPLTRIRIPKLGVSAVVVEGTNATALAAGAGHYRDTPLPGEAGNVSIAGHRTMNGRPFARLDELKPGDTVVLETPFAKHTYQLIDGFGGHGNPWVTPPNDWTVVAASKDSILTLTTCHPKGSARERMIARAKLVNTEPV